MRRARRLSHVVLGLGVLSGAASLALAITGSSVLVAERPVAQGFNRIEYVVGRDDLPRDGWRLECTYFTGHSLVKAHQEIKPCRSTPSQCPVSTCAFLAKQPMQSR